MITPLSPLPFLGFTLILPDNVTVVEANPQPFNNTKEILLLNLSTTDRVFVQVVDLALSGGILPAAGTITFLNSAIVPAGGSLGICFGTEGERNAMATVAFWAVNPGSKLCIVFKSEAGVGVQINVTYVQNVGGSDGHGY